MGGKAAEAGVTFGHWPLRPVKPGAGMNLRSREAVALQGFPKASRGEACEELIMCGGLTGSFGLSGMENQLKRVAKEM